MPDVPRGVGRRTVLVAAGLLTLSGCVAAPASGTEPIGNRRVRVTTTTNFLTDTVGRIGGDRVEVTGLMGPGVDPHLYRASAGDVQALRGADVILYCGLQLEGRMGDLFADLAERQLTSAITDGIPREQLLAGPEAGEEHDPHVWFDPSPVAFAYSARRYNLEVAGIQGISTAAEATTADVERVAQLVAERGVPAVFVESSVPRQTIDALLAAAAQRGAQIHVGGELFTDAAGNPGTPEGTYIGMLRANADRIADGLTD